MSRISLKIVGASGQGIDSIGEILAKALKRSGYGVFGYREYPSLIKGGHASYQLDISDTIIESTGTTVHILLTLNHHGLEQNVGDIKPGGILLHSTPTWKFSEKDQKQIDDTSIRVICLPVEKTLKDMNAKPILGNVLLASFVWATLGQKAESLTTMVCERFAKKKDLLELNKRCIDEGFALHKKEKNLSVTLPKSNASLKDHLLLTGSKAMGLGCTAAGVRLYAGYPMTPSSPLLSYIAAIQNETGMVIKQAEDEITAAQMVSGAMFMGTRAVTATSGGGFDLMSETLSLNAIIENPTVFILAQRPGPATGLPTWTGQGDLLMAIHTAHGEFARCVVAVSNADDAFYLMNEAFTIAEKYQISVIVLTDKHIAEALYTQKPYDMKGIKIDRGSLVTDTAALKNLKSTDRYDPASVDGISPRWLPGSDAATYVAQGDEHRADGSVDEAAENAILQMEKRMKKGEALKKTLPEPTLFINQYQREAADPQEQKDVAPQIDILLIGWGSTKSVILDALQSKELQGKNIGYLHYSYLWPLKTDRLMTLAKNTEKIVLVEGSYQGQLGMLIRQECGLLIENKILKFDGRPFFIDELIAQILKFLPQ
jgi:2-oxoglutarate ferredoxin oxidoreductase subunit alpha